MKNIIFHRNRKENYNMNSKLISEIQEKEYTEFNVNEAAEEVLRHLNINIIPIPIISIIKDFGFEVYQVKIDDNMSGFIAVDDNLRKTFDCDKLIVINSEHNLGHKRFTIAHELGHYLLDYDGKDSVFYNAYYAENSDLPEERRVNKFAANLLMPELMFIDEYNEAKKKDHNIIALLAEKFEVSARAVEIRMEELNLSYDK